ncbi:MAG TPA: hypothetical protein VMR86_04185 [Myxococcota bacterium]|nr:hypothetical protein [Myxococcota bacterium]
MFRIQTAIVAGLSIAVLVGCAHRNESAPASSSSSSSAKPAPAQQAEPAAKPIPKGHPFAKIQEGMSDADVKKILGDPSDRHEYITGKAFIPHYYGSDTSRSEWIYKGKGSIVFSRNRYSGNLSVVEVLYDPSK